MLEFESAYVREEQGASERKGKSDIEPEKSRVLLWAFVCSNTCSYYHSPQETGELMQADLGTTHDHTTAHNTW